MKEFKLNIVQDNRLVDRLNIVALNFDKAVDIVFSDFYPNEEIEIWDTENPRHNVLFDNVRTLREEPDLYEVVEGEEPPLEIETDFMDDLNNEIFD